MAEGRPPQPDIVGDLLPNASPTDVLIIEGLVQHRATYEQSSGHGAILDICDDAFLRPHQTAGEVGRAVLLSRRGIAERDPGTHSGALELAQQLALSGAAFRFSFNSTAVVPPTRRGNPAPTVKPTVHEGLLQKARDCLSMSDWGELAARRAAYNRQPNDPAIYRQMQAGLFATLIEVAYHQTLQHPMIKD